MEKLSKEQLTIIGKLSKLPAEIDCPRCSGVFCQLAMDAAARARDQNFEMTEWYEGCGNPPVISMILMELRQMSQE